LVLSTPARLRNHCCAGAAARRTSPDVESDRLSQPNMSRHLNVLYRAGVVEEALWRADFFTALPTIGGAGVQAVCSQVGQESHAGSDASHSLRT